MLADAMDLSHMYIDIEPAPSISDYANASLEISQARDGRIAIKYAPAHIEELGYLVAHECGHLIRMYSAPEEARLMPVTTAKHRAKVIHDVGHDLRKLHRLGVPEAGLVELAEFLHVGIVRQVMNYPADMRIERWLRTDYPGLSGLQEEALRGQLQDNLKASSPGVREMTPDRMFRAANVMNAAYARYISLLLHDRKLFSPYRRTQFVSEGRELADEIWLFEDKGYYSDVVDTKRWARQLKLDDWFEWRPLGQVQEMHTVR